MRDFVASWYYYVDPGVLYEDEREKRKRQQEQGDKDMEEGEKEKEKNQTDKKSSKAMVFSTARHRPAPMMTAMYQSMGIVFGNLCQRGEGINMFSLLLIKWTKVLSHTFRVYRKLRREVAAKQLHPTMVRSKSRLSASLRGNPIKNDPSASSFTNLEGDEEESSSMRRKQDSVEVSEMAIAREFMRKGKLHKAMTFGMDVPSLLFADAKGKECGVGMSDDSNKELTEDEVLEMRLFDGKILYECEMDYNRVLAHRLVRACLPRAEFSSPIIRTMMIEMIAGCVLTPMMSAFCPEYINGWIIMGCEDAPNGEGEKKEVEKFPSADGNAHETLTDQDEGLMRGWNPRDSVIKPIPVLNEEDTADLLAKLAKGAAGLSEAGEVSVEMTMSKAGLVSSVNGNDAMQSQSSGVEMSMSQTEFFKDKTDVILDDEDEGIDDLEEHKSVENLDSITETHDLKSLIEPENYDKKIDDGVDGSAQNDEGEAEGMVTAGATVDETERKPPPPSGDFVLPLLTMSLMDLQRFMDFQECREAVLNHQEMDLKWKDPELQKVITQLVVVIEAALLHGRRKTKLDAAEGNKGESSGGDGVDNIDESDEAIEVTTPKLSFSNVLMEITSDPDAFEDKIMQEEEDYMELGSKHGAESDGTIDIWQATPAELSTLRSLIVAWLHTGQAHRVMSVLINAEHSILKPWFCKHSFIRTRDSTEGFVRQLRQLNGVHILVDTLNVLCSPSMDVNEDGNTVVPKPDATRRQLGSPAPSVTNEAPRRPSLASEKVQSQPGRKSTRFRLLPEHTEKPTEANISDSTPVSLPQVYFTASSTPRFIDFHRNENFASSLRAERERRMQSWANVTDDNSGLQIICRRRGTSVAAVAAHRELHQVARIFYVGTNMIALRNGARRKEVGKSSGPDSGEVVPLSLFTVEMACQRRRLEVPDDDSSFLLRAQPRPLNAIGVHRDQSNHDKSYKTFAATYEEPAFRPGQEKYTGGKYIRKCVVQYFPNDRTAKIVLPSEGRCLDQRKESTVPSSIDVSMPSVPFISSDFLRERHSCQKWVPKGATPRSGSILASSVMDISDFNSVPRAGRAIDFIYRMSLFEPPMIELSGKKFSVLDSSSMGPHRADASSLEMSDASMSHALLTIGGEWEEQSMDVEVPPDAVEQNLQTAARSSSIEMGTDGYPIIWMKYTRKQGEKNVTEVKSYRTSYIRAALMVTSARHDAQMQCLIKCVRAGSARSATKQRTEAYLQPTARLLEYANSIEREKQSIILRDLKLGINHIDMGQLRRNGLLSPKFPTKVLMLSARCDGAAQMKEQHSLTTSNVTLYKITCTAFVSLEDVDLSGEDLTPYMAPDGSIPEFFREEWIVYRPMKDVQTFHKHLKTQVAIAEQSVSAGARLMGAATAAFTVSSLHGSSRRHKTLVPSLGQTQKAGALGVTKKSIQKRCEVLDGYFRYLLAPDHPLNRCAELMIFLGAYHPLPPEVTLGGDPYTHTKEPFGRMEMKRSIYELPLESHGLVLRQSSIREQSRRVLDDEDTATASVPEYSTTEASTIGTIAPSDTSTRSVSADSLFKLKPMPDEGRFSLNPSEGGEEKKAQVKEIDMIPSIKAKIDEVPLAQVRSALFELVRYQFDFDNASFFRNRMFSAMKTMSFALTSSSDFRKMLYESHTTYASADALANWIKFMSETIFPNGVFMQFSDPTPDEELKRLSQQAKEALLKAFPDQLRSVLGAEIVKGGLDMLHEMLQNRVVLKSMFYMLIDLVWLEVFPELHDILTGPSALESDE
jgi:hypothetical protein